MSQSSYVSACAHAERGGALSSVPAGRAPRLANHSAFTAIRCRAGIALLLVAVLRVNPAIAAEPEAAPELTLEKALEMAVEANPGLAEMRARAAAAAEMPRQAGSLPDPKLNLNALNLPVDTFDIEQEAMTQLQVGMSQAFPFPGKRRLRREVAEYEAQAAADSVEEARLVLMRDVKTVWWELAYLDRAIAIVERNLELLGQFTEIAAAKYRVGKGLQQDVLLAQVERTRLMDRLIALRGIRRGAAERLNALLARPRESAVELPEAVEEELPSVPERDELAKMARTSRPLVAILENRVQAAQSAVALARKSYWPDFTLAANYGFRQDDPISRVSRADFFSVMLSVDIPLYTGSKQDRQVAQKHAELSAQEQALADALNRIDADIQAAWFDLESNREQVTLFATGLLPQARQTVASMLAGYQVNKVDFLNLVQSQVTLYNFEQQYWRVLTQARQALARLAAAIGQENI